MNEITLIIPAVPPSVNELLKAHWAVRGKIKQKFGVAVMMGVSKSEIEPSQFQNPPKKVSLDITVYQGGRGRFLDPDNIQKVLLDCLKNNGVIYDDSAKWCKVINIDTKRDKDFPRTEVIVRKI